MKFSAVLLAGGESRRMGSEKATLLFHGEPLWQRQIRVLRELESQEIFISARSELHWRPADIELILDEAPSRGPLSGLAAALLRMRTNHLLVLAVDMPFMTSEQMRALWGLATLGCGVLPMIGDRAEPLAAIYPREAGGDFATALASDDFSLQRLGRSLVQLDKLQIFEVSRRDEELYRSVNEPGDFKAQPRIHCPNSVDA
jgi:molybdenum cofactor guanylyltransferase